MALMIPHPKVLAAYRNRDTTLVEEISELIDNSLGADRGDAAEVHIYWDNRTKTLIVVDNGRGMREMSYLFRLGVGEDGSNNDIGKYGQGGSGALLWIPDQVTVTTVRDGRRSYTRQNIRRAVDVKCVWLDVTDRWETADVNNVPFPLNRYDSGTQISMRVRDNRRVHGDVIRMALEKRYAAALRKGRRIVWHNGLDDSDVIELHPWNPGDIVNIDESVIEVRGMHATVQAGIGDNISQRNAGISITFGHREIKKTREPLNGWDGGKIFGWVDLAPEWHDYLTNNKTAINDDVLWDELVSAIAVVIAPLLELLDQDAEQNFAAALSLEASLQFGNVLKKLPKPKPDPDEDDDEDEVIDDDHHGEEPPRRPRKKLPPVEPPAAIPIVSEPDRGLEGRMMFVRIHVGERVVVRYDPDSELMQEARQTKPLNKLLMRALISTEFTAAMIRQELVVASGIYSEDEWEQLKEDCEGDQLMVAAYLTPRLFQTIGEPPKEGAA